jgi:hypothetical protein
MFAGDRAFDATDVRSALETMEAPNTQQPEGAGWVPLPASSYNSYLSSLSERRGTGELLGRGLKNIAYGLGTLPGTAATLAGFEETGAALRAPVEAALGDSENEQLRSALIAENSSLWEQIVDGSIESIPLLLTSIAGGAGAASLASRAGMATQGVTRAATAGAAGANFPIHLAGMYDAAVRNQQDLSDPLVKVGVLGGALANSYLDTFGIESRLLSPIVKAAAENAAKGVVRRRLTSGVATGFAEAGTEVTQTFLESVLFDPEVHDNLSPQDWKVLAPYIADRYGEQMLVAAGAGALLGGGVGVVLPQGAFAPGAKPPVPTDKPLDLNTTATEQAAEKEEAPELYGQTSPLRLQIPYVPGAQTVGAMPVAPTGAEQVADPNRPLTLQQVGLMRGATGGLRPEDRAAGNITVPGGDRNVTLEGEVIPPGAAAAAPQAARLRAIGAPAAAAQLPPPGAAAADFTAGPEGVAPTGAAPVTPAAPAAPGARLRVGAAPRAAALPAPPQGAMADQLRAIMAAREQAQATAAAEATAQTEAQRAAQIAAQQRAAETEAAYAQREAQRGTMYNAEQQAAYDQLTAEQRAYVDADAAWEQFRPQDGKAQSGVTLRDLAPKAQRDWVAAVQQGTADQAVYEQLRRRRPVGKAAPIVDTPTILRPAPQKPAPKPKPLNKKQKAVADRFLALAPEQQQAVIAELGGNETAAMALLRSDPDAFNAAIDRVSEPTPPTTPTPTGKATIQRKGAEKPAAPKAGAVAKGKPQPRAEAAPTVTVASVERSPKNAEAPYQVVTLSDGRAIRIRNTGSNFAQVWTFMSTGDVIGEKIKAEAAAARVAELASQGQLPDTVVETEAQAEVAEAPTGVSAADELDADVNDFITVLDSSTDKPSRAAAISGLKDAMADPAMKPALRRRVQDYLNGLDTEVGAVGLTNMTEVNTATAQLSAMITDFNAAPGEITRSWQDQFRRLVAEVRKEDPNARYGDRSLLSYAKADNTPNFARVDGVRKVVGAPGNFSLSTWNTIDGVVDLDGKPVTALVPGRVQLLVRNFLGKLARAPKITVVRNQADLKAKNPQLYARAAAARTQGDFDTAPAMGYSFGDGQVIIFTDRIATEQQLNFVLAHETLGHFGLRGIMPGPKFDALMEDIYTTSPAAKTAADAAMSVRPGLSRAEAVEEYMSDYAAVLETSLVARVWNSIKNFLNKLGIRTGDEMVRYLLDQSRRYVREGKGVTFDAQAFGQRLHSVETSGDTGRFSLGPSFRDVNLMAGLQVDTIGGRPMNFEEGWEYLKRQGVNNVTSWDKFKATFLSLSNFRSRQNPGALTLEKLLDEARNLSMATKVGFNERLALVLNRAIAGEVGGISDEQTQRVNQMLYAAQRFNVAQVQKLGDLGNVPLFRSENGRLIPNQPEIDRLKKLGQRTLEQMRDGFEYDVTFEEAGKTVTKKEKFAGVKGLTKDSIEWRGYEKIRNAMDDIELQLLQARYEGVMQERDLAFRQIAATVPDGELTADERAALTALATTYGDLYTSNIQQDESGRAKLDADFQTYANDILRTANAALIGRDTDRFDALRTLLTTPRQFMKGESDTDVRRSIPAAMEAQAADDLIARLQGFKSRMRIEEDRFVVQNKVKQIILAELAGKDADKFTKRTIATGYTPVLREGAYQIRVEARIGGRVVRLQDSYREQLVYSQFDTAADAMEMKDRVNKMFRGNQFDVMYYDQEAGKYIEGKVELVAVDEAALDSVAAPPQLNLNEFIRGLRQFDIALTPDKMEDVIVALTKQNSAARNRLERVFTPGAQLDGVMATMRHIESRASTIAKIKVRPRLAELMDRSMASTMALWNGSPEQLARLKKRAEDAAKDATLSREAKVDAQREYEQYAYMYSQTNPEGQPRRGNQFYNESARTVAFLDGNQNVDESDFGSGPMVSRIRAATSMMQLGGSVATGALNMLSVYTNGIPYLSSYNAKTAFGGGFSVGKVVSELHRAAAQVGGPGITSGEMNTAEFYEKVAADPALQKRYNLEAHEAAFIAREILDGAMIPAQSNALVGTARGRTTKGFQQKFLDGWMWTFNVTEQASRRSLGLTAYRLEFARKQAAGMSRADAASAAREFAVQTLQYTMGEYSVLNRPPAWRSGIQSFIYMYKVFPTTSVQLFANMSRGGKVGMLAALWMLTGLSGLPFAEDLEDLIDTLAQKLKVAGWQGARYETAQFLDEIFPGMSPFLLKGIVNNYLPADIAGRTSLGDLLPGTDILLAGADVSRGLSEIAGPAPAMLLGTAQFAVDALAIPFSTTTTIESVAREAPVTMVRALADTFAYTQTGAVVDRRGYTVTDDMTTGTLVARALGFYPSAAANQYEMIRSAKRMTDYQREVVTGYRTAWVSAMMRGDREFARQIEQSVEDWNDSAKGTALEIRGFTKNSRRALEEARRPATARTLRSAPNAAEKDLQRMIDLMTLN